MNFLKLGSHSFAGTPAFDGTAPSRLVVQTDSDDPHTWEEFGKEAWERIHPSALLGTAVQTTLFGLAGDTFSIFGYALARSGGLGVPAASLIAALADEAGSAGLMSLAGNGKNFGSNLAEGVVTRLLVQKMLTTLVRGTLPLPIQLVLMAGGMTLVSMGVRSLSDVLTHTGDNPFANKGIGGWGLEFIDTFLTVGIGRGRTHYLNLEAAGRKRVDDGTLDLKRLVGITAMGAALMPGTAYGAGVLDPASAVLLAAGLAAGIGGAVVAGNNPHKRALHEMLRPVTLISRDDYYRDHYDRKQFLDAVANTDFTDLFHKHGVEGKIFLTCDFNTDTIRLPVIRTMDEPPAAGQAAIVFDVSRTEYSTEVRVSDFITGNNGDDLAGAIAHNDSVAWFRSNLETPIRDFIINSGVTRSLTSLLGEPLRDEKQNMFYKKKDVLDFFSSDSFPENLRLLPCSDLLKDGETHQFWLSGDYRGEDVYAFNIEDKNTKLSKHKMRVGVGMSCTRKSVDVFVHGMERGEMRRGMPGEVMVPIAKNKGYEWKKSLEVNPDFILGREPLISDGATADRSEISRGMIPILVESIICGDELKLGRSEGGWSGELLQSQFLKTLPLIDIAGQMAQYPAVEVLKDHPLRLIFTGVCRRDVRSLRLWRAPKDGTWLDLSKSNFQTRLDFTPGQKTAFGESIGENSSAILGALQGEVKEYQTRVIKEKPKRLPAQIFGTELSGYLERKFGDLNVVSEKLFYETLCHEQLPLELLSLTAVRNIPPGKTQSFWIEGFPDKDNIKWVTVGTEPVPVTPSKFRINYDLVKSEDGRSISLIAQGFALGEHLEKKFDTLPHMARLGRSQGVDWEKSIIQNPEFCDEAGRASLEVAMMEEAFRFERKRAEWTDNVETRKLEQGYRAVEKCVADSFLKSKLAKALAREPRQWVAFGNTRKETLVCSIRELRANQRWVVATDQNYQVKFSLHAGQGKHYPRLELIESKGSGRFDVVTALWPSLKKIREALFNSRYWNPQGATLLADDFFGGDVKKAHLYGPALVPTKYTQKWKQRDFPLHHMRLEDFARNTQWRATYRDLFDERAKQKDGEQQVIVAIPSADDLLESQPVYARIRNVVVIPPENLPTAILISMGNYALLSRKDASQPWCVNCGTDKSKIKYLMRLFKENGWLEAA